MPRGSLKLETTLEHLSVLDESGELDQELEEDLLLRIHRTVVEAVSGEDGVTVTVDGEEEDFDAVLVAVGRIPVTDDIGLENTGVTLDDDGYIQVDEAGGFVKLTVDPSTNRVLGVGMTGRHVESLISEAALALEMGATATPHDSQESS